jgi:hypothetical protein
VIEADILLSPRFGPKVRLLSELSPLLEESVGPLLVLLLLILVVVEDDGTEISDVVVVGVSPSGELASATSSKAAQICAQSFTVSSVLAHLSNVERNDISIYEPVHQINQTVVSVVRG